MSSNVPELFQKHRAHSAGEIIADAAVHAIAIVAGMIGFSVLFQKIALHGAVGDGAGDGGLRRGVLPAVRLLLRLQHDAAVGRQGDPQALRSRLDLSDDRGHLYRAPVAGARLVRPRGAGERGLGGGDRRRVAEDFSCPAVSTASPCGFISRSAGRRCSPQAAGRRAADGHPRARPRRRLVYSIGVAFFLWESLKFQTAIWHVFVAVAAAIQFAGVLTAIGR